MIKVSVFFVFQSDDLWCLFQVHWNFINFRTHLHCENLPPPSASQSATITKAVACPTGCDFQVQNISQYLAYCIWKPQIITNFELR